MDLSQKKKCQDPLLKRLKSSKVISFIPKFHKGFSLPNPFNNLKKPIEKIRSKRGENN